MKARQLVPAAVFAVVVGLVVLTYVDTGALLNHFDDAYITYRYAIHLADGRGLVFNVGERTDAASSFLFTVLLSAVYRLGFHDLERASLVLGLASTGGAAAVVCSGAFYLSRRWLLAAGLGVAAGMHGLMSGWAVSGMETTFYALLVTLFFERCFIRGCEDRWSALLLVLVVLTRVEGVLVAAVWALARANSLVFAQGERPPASLRRALEHGAIVGVAIVCFFSFKLFYYGTLLPHTFQLKQFIFQYQANRDALWSVWCASALGIMLLGAAGAASLPRSTNRLGAAVMLVLGAASCAVGPYADWARYSVYLLPPLVLLSAVPLGLMLEARRLRATGALLIALVGYNVYTSCQGMRYFMWSFADHQRCRKEVGSYLAKTFDRSQAVMSSDLGAISYRAIDFSFVDLFGLTSSDIMMRYRDGRNADEVLQRRRPSIAADTWKPLGGKWVYSAEALLLWPMMILLKEIEPSDYARHFQHEAPVFTCASRDGLFFAVGPIPLP